MWGNGTTKYSALDSDESDEDNGPASKSTESAPSSEPNPSTPDEIQTIDTALLVNFADFLQYVGLNEQHRLIIKMDMEGSECSALESLTPIISATANKYKRIRRDHFGIETMIDNYKVINYARFHKAWYDSETERALDLHLSSVNALADWVDKFEKKFKMLDEIRSLGSKFFKSSDTLDLENGFYDGNELEDESLSSESKFDKFESSNLSSLSSDYYIQLQNVYNEAKQSLFRLLNEIFDPDEKFVPDQTDNIKNELLNAHNEKKLEEAEEDRIADTLPEIIAILFETEHLTEACWRQLAPFFSKHNWQRVVLDFKNVIFINMDLVPYEIKEGIDYMSATRRGMGLDANGTHLRIPNGMLEDWKKTLHYEFDSNLEESDIFSSRTVTLNNNSNTESDESMVDSMGKAISSAGSGYNVKHPELDPQYKRIDPSTRLPYQVGLNRSAYHWRTYSEVAEVSEGVDIESFYKYDQDGMDMGLGNNEWEYLYVR